jgi:N-methylhydantoinase A/oxoprolinase/acetone carboxylase beta subunit
MIREVAQKIDPSLPLSLSHEVLGELREYERTIATILNAYVMPKVGDYLETIESGFAAIGLNARLRVMQSNGGVISKSFGARFPIRLLESGPAAGALGAARTAQALGHKQLIAFDMGGTTAKACLISEGEPGITTEFEAARTQRFKKGSGLPVRIPTVDLIEIGAGGGSIAYIDNTGLLKVGPHSAGSQPGPACYGLGGALPTVTDAALLLGYLDPAANLSDAVILNADLAGRAMHSHVASKLGLSIYEAAAGVHRIVCEQMAAAAKIHAVEKAKDIRQCTLLAFGGAGPIHARELARRTASKHIVVPPGSGVFSAFGLLVAPMKLDIVRTRYIRLEDIDFKELEHFIVSMENQLSRELETSRVQPDSTVIAFQSQKPYRFVRYAEMRYVGQGFELSTRLPENISGATVEDIGAAFECQYKLMFGSSIEGAELEVLNWRVEAFAYQGRAIQPKVDQEPPRSEAWSSRRRRAFFPCVCDWIETPVISEQSLPFDRLQTGPALIEQAGSTVVVGPGDQYHKDRFGNIHIALAKGAVS